MTKKILFVGLGMMGYPMAALLARAGYALWVNDADPGVAQKFAREHGAEVFSLGDLHPASVAPDFQHVITMLPNSDIVEAVILGNARNGISYMLPAVTTFIDMSSSEPMRSRHLASTLAENGHRYLDAPVSGGVKKAIEGTLAIMVGGEESVFADCNEVLRVMGKTLFHVGSAGAGHAMKALNNYVSAAGLVAVVEALQVGQRFGLDPAVMVDVLNSSTGRNNTSEQKAKQFMLSGTFASGFSQHLMTKDLGVAMKLAEQLDYPMRQGKQCLQIWKDAAGQVPPATDHTEMYKLLS